MSFFARYFGASTGNNNSGGSSSGSPVGPFRAQEGPPGNQLDRIVLDVDTKKLYELDGFNVDGEAEFVEFGVLGGGGTSSGTNTGGGTTPDPDPDPAPSGPLSYWGVVQDASVNTAAKVKALSGSEEQNSRGKTFSISESGDGWYAYYAYPASLGSPAPIVQFGGFNNNTSAVFDVTVDGTPMKVVQFGPQSNPFGDITYP